MNIESSTLKINMEMHWIHMIWQIILYEMQWKAMKHHRMKLDIPVNMTVNAMDSQILSFYRELNFNTNLCASVKMTSIICIVKNSNKIA